MKCGVRSILLIGCALLLAVMPMQLTAQVNCTVPSLTMTEVGKVQLPSYADTRMNPVRVKMHVDGDYVYIGDYVSREVYIYNVADKSSPNRVSRIQTQYGNIHDIWYDDGYVYTGHRGGGITMINVTDPSAPSIARNIGVGYIHRGLATVGNYLFCGKGFSIYEIDKTGGNLLVRSNLGNHFDGFEVVATPNGDYAYRGIEWGVNQPLGVYNVQNKSNPQFVKLFHENTGEYPPGEMEISPDGNFLYALTNHVPPGEAGFRIYNIANPADPQLLSHTAHANILSLSLDNVHKILYVRDSKLGTDCSIREYDVVDPSSPNLIDCYYFPPSSFLNRDTGYVEAQDGDLWYSNGYIYAVYDDDLVILQVNSNVAPVAAISVNPLSGIEGSDMAVDASGSYDLNGDALTYSWDFDDGDTLSGNDAVVIHTFQDNGAFHVCVTVSDGTDDDTACLDVTVDNAVPSVDPVAVPVEMRLVSVGDTVEVHASFTDPGSLDTHTGVFAWGDGETSDGVVTDTGGSGVVEGSHKYDTAGQYKVMLDVTDKDGGTGHSFFESVIVYDPDAGHLTGGGWVASPLGSCMQSPDFEGKANIFEGKSNIVISSKYKKGARVPTGKFKFRACGLEFLSEDQEWLVATRAGSKKAIIKGGTNDWKFLVWAGDNTPENPDTVHVKIWDTNTGDVMYDNGVDQALSGGSIVIHRAKAKNRRLRDGRR